MDRKYRKLERLAVSGDVDAQLLLENMRRHLGLCPQHGLRAKEYDLITEEPDPVGWGTGCPVCEEKLFCSSGTCGLSFCHNCNPDFDCEYGHEKCDEIYTALWTFGMETIPLPRVLQQFEEDPEDTGQYDCISCRGTGIGYRPDSSCPDCGGSGIPRRSRRDRDDWRY